MPIMAPFSTIAAFTLMMVAPQPHLGRLSGSCEVAGADSCVLAAIACNPANSSSESATAGSGRLLQSAAVTPSAKLVIPRLRERTSHRDGLPLPIAMRLEGSSSVTLRAGLVPRCAILRI